MMVLIIVNEYVLSVNLLNILFMSFCISFYSIILAPLRDISTLVRITLFPIILLKIKTIGYLLSQPITRCVQSWISVVTCIY